MIVGWLIVLFGCLSRLTLNDVSRPLQALVCFASSHCQFQFSQVDWWVLIALCFRHQPPSHNGDCWWRPWKHQGWWHTTQNLQMDACSTSHEILVGMCSFYLIYLDICIQLQKKHVGYMLDIWILMKFLFAVSSDFWEDRLYQQWVRPSILTLLVGRKETCISNNLTDNAF